MAILTITGNELRKIIRESLMLERPFGGDVTDFFDAVETSTAELAAGGRGATPEEQESAQAFMDLHVAGGDAVVDLLTQLGEKWNNSPFKFIIKIPGLAGAEDYEWSDFAIDAFILVAGGGIAGAALKGVGLAGSGGAAAARAARGIYAAASRRVGPGVMRKAVQQGLKAVGAAPTDAIVKETLLAIRDSAEDDIVIEVSPEEFKEAMNLIKAEGGPVLQDETELAQLAAKANETFGIDV